MLPAYIVASALIGTLVRVVQVGTAQAWMLFALQAAVAIAMAWIVTRYIDRPLAAADPLPTGAMAAPPAPD
jgi:peptidoglycan/LPS O-acetylase OafA/YrhL